MSDDVLERIRKVQGMEFLCARCKNVLVEMVLEDPGAKELAELEKELGDWLEGGE